MPPALKQSPESELLSALQNNANAKTVTDMVVNKVGFDKSLTLYFSDNNFRSAWDSYFNVTSALKKEGFWSSIIYNIFDTKQEDRVQVLVSAINDKFVGEDKNSKIAKIYMISGWDPERTAEFIADDLKLANMNRALRWEANVENEKGEVTKRGKGGVQFEVEGGAAYQYDHDPIFKKCWDAYYTGKFDGGVASDSNASIRADRFSQLISESSEWFDYPKVIADQLVQLGNANMYPELYGAVKNWWKERSLGSAAASFTWEGINFVIPMESTFYLAANSQTYKNAQSSPNPMNIFAAIKEDQANTVDVVATLAVFLKFVKIGKATKAAGKTLKGGEAAIESSKKILTEAAEATKKEAAKKLEGDALEQFNAKVDAATNHLMGNLNSKDKFTLWRERFPLFKDTLRSELEVATSPEKFTKLIEHALLRDFERMPIEAQLDLVNRYFDIEISLKRTVNAAKTAGEVTGEAEKGAATGKKLSAMAQRAVDLRKEIADKIAQLKGEIDALEEAVQTTHDAAKKAELRSSIALKQGEIAKAEDFLKTSANIGDDTLVRKTISSLDEVQNLVRGTPGLVKAGAEKAEEVAGLRARMQARLLDFEQRESRLLEVFQKATSDEEKLSAFRDYMAVKSDHFKVVKEYTLKTGLAFTIPADLLVVLSQSPPWIANIILRRFPSLFEFATPVAYYQARTAAFTSSSLTRQQSVKGFGAEFTMSQVEILKSQGISDENIKFVLSNASAAVAIGEYISISGSKNIQRTVIEKLIKHFRNNERIRTEFESLGFLKDLDFVLNNKSLRSEILKSRSINSNTEDRMKTIDDLISKYRFGKRDAGTVIDGATDTGTLQNVVPRRAVDAGTPTKVIDSADAGPTSLKPSEPTEKIPKVPRGVVVPRKKGTGLPD